MAENSSGFKLIAKWMSFVEFFSISLFISLITRFLMSFNKYEEAFCWDLSKFCEWSAKILWRTDVTRQSMIFYSVESFCSSYSSYFCKKTSFFSFYFSSSSFFSLLLYFLSKIFADYARAKEIESLSKVSSFSWGLFDSACSSSLFSYIWN